MWVKNTYGIEKVIGRIYYSTSVSARGETPWFWSIYGTSHQGICENREAAMEVLSGALVVGGLIVTVAWITLLLYGAWRFFDWIEA